MTISTADFLVSLNKIARSGLQYRDPILLYAIMCNPGINGKDLATKLAIPERSHIQSALIRLEQKGLIEDHRVNPRKANPSLFYATPAGIDLWNSFLPCKIDL